MFENWPHDQVWITDPLINYLLFTLLVFIPLYKIAKRLGLPVWTALPTFIPYVGFIITTALFAHMRWNIELDQDQNNNQQESNS